MQKILFFDDEPFITKYIVRNLKENFGWNGEREITLVPNVEELLQTIDSDDLTYDLFVLDLMVPMPSGEVKKQFSQDELDNMDEGRLLGWVMANKIRKKEKYKKVPVLYLSARSTPPISDAEKGYTVYIRKPVSPVEISRIMNELLETNKDDKK